MIENIDLPKAKQKISYIRDNLNKLMQLKGLSKEDFLGDFRNVDSAKYLLQISIEAMLDISNHIIARNRWGKPETNKDCFEILSKHGVIQEKYVNTYFVMSKFRNRIVHMYFDVDNEVIYETVQNNLNDIEKFIEMIIEGIV